MVPEIPTPNGKTPKANAKKAAVDPNVHEVMFGNLLIRPWYPSFYPEQLVGRSVERLYVCQWCFKYSKELMAFLGHLKCCDLRPGGGEGGEGCGVPGEEIYRKDGFSLYEIDGEEYKLYAQNLSLFAKLFLDTKSVFYDVTTFLYYLLVAHNPSPAVTTSTLPASSSSQPQQQVVGFFSKEKMSWDNNNLACILVFPPWQKQGLGQILMGASYEMSKREGRLGGPEKPLSELGRRGYIHYWSQTLARTIFALPAKKTLSVLDLQNETYIVPEDVIATLQAMDVLENRKKGGAEMVINKAKVKDWIQRNKVNLESPVDPDAFVQDDEEEEEEEDEEDELAA